MKAVMINIRPEWVQKILNGEKTIEIRKTMPKCELPCKVYIYCTNSKPNLCDRRNADIGLEDFEFVNNLGSDDILLNGKVVAEFTLKSYCIFDPLGECTPQWKYSVGKILGLSGLTQVELFHYLNCKKGYGWFISELKIYDRPKELSEFQKDLDCDDYPCNKGKYCKYDYFDDSEGCRACGIDFDGTHCIYKQLTKVPQGWCYVEELEAK